MSRCLVLSNSRLCHVSCRSFIQRRHRAGTSVALSMLPMSSKRTSDLNLVGISNLNHVVSFDRGPGKRSLERVRISAAALNLSPKSTGDGPCVTSVNVCLFGHRILVGLLGRCPRRASFNGRVVPGSTGSCQVRTCLFGSC